MHMLPLQAVVMVEPLRVDQRRATLTVLRKNFLSVLPPDLFAKLGKPRPCSRKRNNVLGRNRHEISSLRSSINYVQNSVKNCPGDLLRRAPRLGGGIHHQFELAPLVVLA